MKMPAVSARSSGNSRENWRRNSVISRPTCASVRTGCVASPSCEKPTPAGLSTMSRLYLAFQVWGRGERVPLGATITGPISVNMP